MSERIRNEIQAAACQAFGALNRGEVDEVQAALFRILDILDHPTTMEHVTLRSEPGRFQIMMQMAG